MKIDIYNFKEKFIASKLKNGLTYWKKDQFEIVEESPSVLKANVFGTDEYQSEIRFSGNFVTDINCNCPDNRSLFCKHIAILYYEKLKDELALKKASIRKPRSVSVVANKKIADLEKKLNELSIAELKKIILTRSEVDDNFKDYLDLFFNSGSSSPDSLYKITKVRIYKYLKDNKKEGFISYSSSNKIGHFVNEIADNAVKLYEAKQFSESFAVCKAVIEAMIKPLLITDTSSGLFYQGLEECIALISQMSLDKELSTFQIKEQLTFLLREAQNKMNFDFGYERKFLEIAFELSDNTNKEKLKQDIQRFYKQRK